jgi:hypothetical protein
LKHAKVPSLIAIVTRGLGLASEKYAAHTLPMASQEQVLPALLPIMRAVEEHPEDADIAEGCMGFFQNFTVWHRCRVRAEWRSGEGGGGVEFFSEPYP